MHGGGVSIGEEFVEFIEFIEFVEFVEFVEFIEFIELERIRFRVLRKESFGQGSDF